MERDPSMRATLKVQSKNNIIEAGLRKQLHNLQHECDINLSQIDHERLDARDFLKEIRRCTSDDLPEVKHWLGNRTPSGKRIPRVTRLTFRTNTMVNSSDPDEQARQVEQLEYGQEHENTGFRGSKTKPELVQRAMVLQRLFSKRNLYAGIGHPWDAWGMVGYIDPESDRDLDSAGTGNLKQDSETLESDIQHIQSGDELGNSRQSGFKGHGSRADDMRSSRLNRSQNFIPRSPSKSQQFHREPSKHHQSHSPTDCGRPNCKGVHPPQNDFMRDLLVGNSSKRWKRKQPLQERINNFFERMEVAKDDARRRAAIPPPMELQRRWMALMHGVKTALAESSDDDEEDLDMLHTL